MHVNLSSTKALLVGLLVVTAGFAGCADASENTADDSEVPSFASYDEAKQAPGTVWEANNTDTPIKLRLLYPSGETVETGEHEIVFLLYDSEADEPVEGISFESQDEYEEDCSPRHAFCARMPAMGHGTSPEESPEHVGHGVYRGMTTFTMSGDWMLHVRPLIDGEVHEYDVDLNAEGGGEGDMDMEH
jgi:hypothetical protein